MPAAGAAFIHTVAGALEDLLWLVLLVLLFPLGILLIGTPIALCVRAMIEIARRL